MGLTVDEAQRMMAEEPHAFRLKVHESLQRQVKAINALAAKGMRFWDYGNSFLMMAAKAEADVLSTDGIHHFRYPSYVEDIMGDIFELGFGPFRWICSSGSPEDLHKTDVIAASVIVELMQDCPTKLIQQY